MITIEEKNIEAAYKVADENGKKLLDALFGAKKQKPNLDDYTSIKTYEDACEALGVTPVYSDSANRAICEHINGHWDYRQDLPDHIIALLKLETISRALWGREFQPEPDAEGSKNYWYPWFALWTKEEINERRDGFNGALLSASAGIGAAAGFGCLDTVYRSSNASATFGFRLCQETEEKAKYFGQQFIELWADYLAFNFTVGERIS